MPVSSHVLIVDKLTALYLVILIFDSNGKRATVAICRAVIRIHEVIKIHKITGSLVSSIIRPLDK